MSVSKVYRQIARGVEQHSSLRANASEHADIIGFLLTLGARADLRSASSPACYVIQILFIYFSWRARTPALPAYKAIEIKQGFDLNAKAQFAIRVENLRRVFLKLKL